MEDGSLNAVEPYQKENEMAQSALQKYWRKGKSAV